MRLAGYGEDGEGKATQPGFVKRPGLPDAFQEEPGTFAWRRSMQMAAEMREQEGLI